MAERASNGRGRGDWLSELPFQTIVFHRTVGLFRSLEETVFPERATPAGRENARERLCSALADAATASRRRFAPYEGGYEALLGDLGGAPQGSPFFEGLPIPPDPKAARWPDAVWADFGGGAVTAVVNAEDHLSLFDRSEAPFARQWRTLDAVADAVGKSAPFAYSPDYGFLSANPDHVGTGLVLSCDVSLFGLCVDRTLDASLRALDRLGFVTEPVFPNVPSDNDDDNAVDAPGCRYRISSVHDTGAARDVVGRMDAVCREVARQEQNARLRLLDAQSPELEDFIARSLSAGASARTMGLGEAADIAFAALFAEDLGLLRLTAKQRDLFRAAPYLLSDARILAAAAEAKAPKGAPPPEPRVLRATLMRKAFRTLPGKFLPSR